MMGLRTVLKAVWEWWTEPMEDPHYEGYQPRKVGAGDGPPEPPPSGGPVEDPTPAEQGKKWLGMPDRPAELWLPDLEALAMPPAEHRLPAPMTVGIRFPGEDLITRVVVHRQELLLLSHGIDPRDVMLEGRRVPSSTG